MAKATKKQAADFDDEDEVLAEMATALDLQVEDLRIKDSHLKSFRKGHAYEVSTSGGRKSWIVVEDEDVAYNIAVASVEQDLDSEPENFDQNFLAQHINTDRLASDLTSDVENERYEYYKDLDAEDFWREAQQHGMDVPDEDEDGEMREPEDEEIVDLAERATSVLLKDPIQYLQDIYGDEEGVVQAMKIGGFDTTKAAEDAVDTDGWEHFLSGYDGNSENTASGFVFWREN